MSYFSFKVQKCPIFKVLNLNKENLSGSGLWYFSCTIPRPKLERVKECNQFWLRLRLRSGSDFERSNVSLKENKPDGVDPNSNDLDYCVRKNKEKIIWFSAD